MADIPEKSQNQESPPPAQDKILSYLSGAAAIVIYSIARANLSVFDSLVDWKSLPDSSWAAVILQTAASTSLLGAIRGIELAVMSLALIEVSRLFGPAVFAIISPLLARTAAATVAFLAEISRAVRLRDKEKDQP